MTDPMTGPTTSQPPPAPATSLPFPSLYALTDDLARAEAETDGRFYLQQVWDAVDDARAKLVRYEELPPAAVEIGGLYQCLAAVLGEFSWSDPFLTRPDLIAPVRRGAARLGASALETALAAIERSAAQDPAFAAFRAGAVGDDAELDAIERRMVDPLAAALETDALAYPDALVAHARDAVRFETFADAAALRAAWRARILALPDYEARLPDPHPMRLPTSAPAAVLIGERHLADDLAAFWRKGGGAAPPAAFAPVLAALSPAERNALDALDRVWTTGGPRLVAAWPDHLRVFAEDGAPLS